MNMIRAGVVEHPAQWKQSGYNEIQNPSKRYGLINYLHLMKLLNIHDLTLLKTAHNKWVDTALGQSSKRDSKWTKSIAVGDKNFIKKTKKILGAKANGRREVKSETGYELKETHRPYGNTVFQEIEIENKFYWNLK